MHRIDFLRPQDAHQSIEVFYRRGSSRRRKRSEITRAFFIFLSLTILFSTSSFAPLFIQAASPFTENFTATTNIDTVNSTATVDTLHNQARLSYATQDAWTRVTGFTDGETIYDIAFVPSSTTTGWAVTGSGNIKKTIDSGVLWSVQTSGTSQPLRSLVAIDASTAVAVGGSDDDTTGIVLKTTDGGATWSQQTVSGAPTLYDVYFTSSSNGWVAGANGKIYRTTDGGSNWSTLTSGTTSKLTGVYLDPSGTKGTIVGSGGTILRSTDSGVSWNTRSTANATEAAFLPQVDFKGLHFRNGNTGWLFGAGGTVFKTTDHGDTALTIQSVGTISNVLLEAAIAAYLLTNNPGAFRSTVQPIYNGWFADDNTGIAVGGAGTILKTTNSGTTWAHQAPAVNQPLYSAVMLSATNAFVSGGAAIIFNTTNGGTSWNEMTQGSGDPLAVDFAPSSATGWTVGNGGFVLKTTDSGTTWIGTTSPNYNRNFLSVSAADANTLWTVGSSGAIYKSTDGGVVWTDQTPSGLTTTLNAVRAFSTTAVVAAGNSGTIYTTSDGGTTWTARTSGTSNHLRGIGSSNGTTIWAVGDSGTILKSTDSGATWSAQVSGVATALSGAYAQDSNTVYVAGASGVIVNTTNGGTSWSAQISGTTNNLVTVDSDGTRVWVAGSSGTIVSTTDSGTTWSALTSGVTTDLYSVSSSAANAAIVVGDQENILQTTNGTAWTTIHSDVVRLVNDVASADTTTFYASGFNGLIIKSADAGVSWSVLTSGTSSDLFGVAVASATTAWVAGDDGTILKTTDGATWSAQVSGTAQNLNDIEDASSSALWAVGASGTILKTTDGATWSAQSSGVSVNLQSVDAVDTNTAFAVGKSGTILKTTSGGTAWTALTSGTAQNLYGVSFIDSSTGWVSGAGGTILKTTDSGATWTALTSGTTSTIGDIQFTDSQTGFAVLSANDNTILHSTNGGTSWTTTTGVTGGNGIWMASFDTVAAVGAGHTTNRYTPTYSSGPLTVISTNQHTDTATAVTKATLTATATLNSQTITYYMVNSDTAANCGTTPWQQATSGTELTFSGVNSKLYWCAALSTSSSTVSPRLSSVNIVYTTTPVGRRGGDDGNNGNGGGDNPPPACTVNCQVTLGPTAPVASDSVDLNSITSDSIQWRFTDTAGNESGFILSERGGNNVLRDITQEANTNLAWIMERNLAPNTRYANRVVQAYNSMGRSPETLLPAVTTRVVMPPAPNVAPATATQNAQLIVRRGGNPETTDLLLYERRSQMYLQTNGSLDSHLNWRAFSQWGDAVLENGVVSTTMRAISLGNLPVNRQYAFQVKARNLDGVETEYSDETAMVLPIEAVNTVRIQSEGPDATDLLAVSNTFDGHFTDLTKPNAAILFELTTIDNQKVRDSGWIQQPLWHVEGLTPGIPYRTQATSRSVDGIVTLTAFGATIIISPVTKPSTPVILTPDPKIVETVDPSSLVISGTALSGSTIEITIGQRIYEIITNTSGQWSKKLMLEKGRYTATVKSLSADASSASSIASVTFIVDTVAPPPLTEIEPPMITTPHNGDVVAKSVLIVAGTAENAESVAITVDGSALRKVLVKDGAWSEAIVLGKPGSHRVGVRSIKGDLESKETVAAVTLSVNPIPPSPLLATILAPSENYVVTSLPIRFIGTASLSIAVELTINSDQIIVGFVNADGTWELSRVLASGDYTVTAVALNDAGERSGPTQPVHFRVELPSVLAAPRITAPEQGATVRRRAVLFQGIAPVEAQRVVLAIVPASGDRMIKEADIVEGTWKITVALESGQYAATAIAVAPSSLESAASQPRSFSVDTTVAKPDPPVVIFPTRRDILRALPIEFRGTAPKESSVALRVGGEPELTTAVDKSGRWKIASRFKDGQYKAWLQTIDASGERSDNTTVDVVLDQSPLAPPRIDAPAESAEVTAKTVTVAGIAPLDTSVRVTVGEQTKTIRARSGAWRTTWILENGSYEAAAVAISDEGIRSAEQARRSFTVNVPPSAPELPRPPAVPTPVIPTVDTPPQPPSDQPPAPPSERRKSDGAQPVDVSTPADRATESASRLKSDQQAGILQTTEQLLRFAGLLELRINDQSIGQLNELPRLSIAQEQPVSLTGKTVLPYANVTISLYSQPRIITTTSDGSGLFSVTIDPTNVESIIEHRITVKTSLGQLENPEITFAYLTIPSTNPVLSALPQPVAERLVIAGSTIGEAVDLFVEAVVAPAAEATRETAVVAKKAAVKTAQATKQAAIATHEVIVKAEPETKAALIATLPVVTIVNPPVVATIPQLPFIFYHAFTWVLSFLGLKKKRVPWGVVYDAITKESIALVIVRLIDTRTNRMVETQVTDRAGRFGFIAKPGSYRIEAAKSLYTFPSALIKGSEDGQYQALYHQELFVITSDQQVVSMAIPVDPANQEELKRHQSGLKNAWQAFGRWNRKLHLPVMIAGSVVAVAVFVNVPTPSNALMASLYAVMAFFQHLITPRQLKSWGFVYDAMNFHPVALAIVDIIDMKYHKLLKSRLSDYEGRFAFLPPKGVYKLNVRKEGYRFPAPDAKPTKKFKNPYRGDELTLERDDGFIATDIPIAPVLPGQEPSPASTAPPPRDCAQIPQPLVSPSSNPMLPPPLIPTPSPLLLGRDHEAMTHSL